MFTFHEYLVNAFQQSESFLMGECGKFADGLREIRRQIDIVLGKVLPQFGESGCYGYKLLLVRRERIY
jgi:hypothetical protein